MLMRSLAALALGFALLSQARAADWPQWRGPNPDGKSTETGLLTSWPEGEPELLWSANGLGKGWSPPSIDRRSGDTMNPILLLQQFRFD